MNQLPATYTTTKEINPDEQVTYKAIGIGVYAFRGDEHPSLICECHSPRPAWRGLTYNQACEMAEKIAAMLNGQAI